MTETKVSKGGSTSRFGSISKSIFSLSYNINIIDDSEELPLITPRCIIMIGGIKSNSTLPRTAEHQDNEERHITPAMNARPTMTCDSITLAKAHDRMSLVKTYHSPSPLLTSSLTFFSYSSLLSLHIFAASTLAGLSSFGSASILITEIKIFSTL